jgi:hypothetical protein
MRFGLFLLIHDGGFAMEGLLSLFEQLMVLGGFAALISVIINVLKTIGVVKDGQAGMWSAGLNLAGLIALFATGIVAPEFDISGLDENIAQIAEILSLIFAFITQNWISKGTHTVFSSGQVPIIGRSFSNK